MNTGRYVGKKSKEGRLEDTIVKTNLEAVKEIVRQIRLRDLGGIIVLDFIDMEEKKNRQKVLQAVELELKKDRSPSKALQVSDFGLIIITRKRVKQSLERVMTEPCPYCSGTGTIKNTSTGGTISIPYSTSVVDPLATPVSNSSVYPWLPAASVTTTCRLARVGERKVNA